MNLALISLFDQRQLQDGIEMLKLKWRKLFNRIYAKDKHD